MSTLSTENVTLLLTMFRSESVFISGDRCVDRDADVDPSYDEILFFADLPFVHFRSVALWGFVKVLVCSLL